MFMWSLLHADDADRLARTIATVGLASNFDDQERCADHMKLYSRNIAREAGATDKQIDIIAEQSAVDKDLNES